MDTNFNWGTYFPDHVFRYLPGGRNGKVYQAEYNTHQKLDVYFTVNGFSNFDNAKDIEYKKEFKDNQEELKNNPWCCTAPNVTSLNTFFADFD